MKKSIFIVSIIFFLSACGSSGVHSKILATKQLDVVSLPVFNHRKLKRICITYSKGYSNLANNIKKENNQIKYFQIKTGKPSLKCQIQIFYESNVRQFSRRVGGTSKRVGYFNSYTNKVEYRMEYAPVSYSHKVEQTVRYNIKDLKSNKILDYGYLKAYRSLGSTTYSSKPLLPTLVTGEMWNDIFKQFKPMMFSAKKRISMKTRSFTHKLNIHKVYCKNGKISLVLPDNGRFTIMNGRYYIRNAFLTPLVYLLAKSLSNTPVPQTIIDLSFFKNAIQQYPRKMSDKLSDSKIELQVSPYKYFIRRRKDFIALTDKEFMNTAKQIDKIVHFLEAYAKNFNELNSDYLIDLDALYLKYKQI